MVERSHRTLISVISKKIATEGNSWDRWLGFSLAAMRIGIPPLDPSSESERDIDETRSNKLVDRQRRPPK